MKLVKNIFIISLVNFSVLLGLLFYFGGQTQVSPISPIVPSPTEITTPTPSSVIASPTQSGAAIPAPKAPTSTPRPTSTPAPTPTVDPLAGKCIITIDGLRYDITVFRNIHSGGDVFTCGTDMSQIFHDRHSNRFLNIMAQYRI